MNTPGAPSPSPRPQRPVPTLGSIDIRVRYCECDPMGVAHHGSYPAWLEMGRTELLREAGVSYADLEHAGIFLVVTRLSIRYRRPLYYDDLVTIHTRVVGGSRVTIGHEYEIALKEPGSRGAPRSVRSAGESMAAASTQLACVGRDGRIADLPDWLVG